METLNNKKCPALIKIMSADNEPVLICIRDPETVKSARMFGLDARLYPGKCPKRTAYKLHIDPYCYKAGGE